MGAAFTGSVGSLLWRGAAVSAGVERTAKEAAREFVEAVLEDAQQHVPYDLGTLSDSADSGVQSGHDSRGRFTAGAEAFIWYDTPYAVRLHEHPEYNFQGQGEGKWLYKAMHRAEPMLSRGLAPRFVYFFRQPEPF